MLSIAPLFKTLWPADQCSRPNADAGRDEATVDGNAYHDCEFWLQNFPCDAELLQVTTLPDTCQASTMCATTASAWSADSGVGQ